MGYEDKVAEFAAFFVLKRVALICSRDGSSRVHTAAHRTGVVLYEDLGLPNTYMTSIDP